MNEPLRDEVLLRQEGAQLRPARSRGRPILYTEAEMEQALRDAAADPARRVRDRYGRFRNLDDRNALSRRQYTEWAKTRSVPSASTIEKYYGSWAEALERAGLRPWHRSPRTRR